MNLKFLSGNPLKKKGKGKHKGKAKHKKAKKNPVDLIRTKKGKSKKMFSYLTPKESQALEAVMKRADVSGAAKGAGYAAVQKNKKVIGKVEKYAVSTALYNKKMKLAKKKGDRVFLKEQKSDEVLKTLSKIHPELGKAYATDLKSKYSKKSQSASAKAKKARIKKGKAQVAKQRKAKIAALKKELKSSTDKEAVTKKISSLSKLVRKKKAMAKKKKTKKKVKKVKSKVKVSKKAKSKGAKMAKKSRKKKAHKKATLKKGKKVVIYRTRKSGKAMKPKTIKAPKRGFIQALVNPLPQVDAVVEKATGHSAMEIGGLFVAGSVVGTVDAVAMKGLAKVQELTGVAIPESVARFGGLVLTSAIHYALDKKMGRGHKATKAVKTLIAAQAVNLGAKLLGSVVSQYASKIPGMSGVEYFPMSGVEYFPMSGVPSLGKSSSAVPEGMHGVEYFPMSGPGDYGGGGSIQSSANFGGPDFGSLDEDSVEDDGTDDQMGAGCA